MFNNRTPRAWKNTQFHHKESIFEYHASNERVYAIIVWLAMLAGILIPTAGIVAYLR